MRITLFIFISLLLACNSYQRIAQPEIVDLDEYLNLDLEAQEKFRNALLQNSHLYLDTVIKKTYASEYIDCDANTHHHSSYFDLLAYYYSYHRFERHILETTFSEQMRTGKPNVQRWRDCVRTLEKKDCDSRFYFLRLNFLPWIIRDTTSMDSALSLLSNVEDALQEDCYHTLNYLQSELQWRKQFMEGLKIQLSFFSKDEDAEYYNRDVYKLMEKIPDQTTSDFAYEMLMNQDEIPDEVVSILYDRGGLSSKRKYATYLGEGIVYSDDQIRSIKKRLQDLQAKNDCSWCNSLISNLIKVD